MKCDYVKVEDVKKMIEVFNRSSDEKVVFYKILDRSYFKPRWKERHNVLCYKNLKIVAHNEMKTVWRVENESHKVIFKDSLGKCLIWIKENNNEV